MFVRPPLTLDSLFSFSIHVCKRVLLFLFHFSPSCFPYFTLDFSSLLFFFGSYFRGGNDGRKGLLHYHIGSQAHAALLLRSRSESLVFGSATMNDVIAVDGLHATTVALVSRSLPLRAPHRQCNISNNCKLNYEIPRSARVYTIKII